MKPHERTMELMGTVIRLAIYHDNGEALLDTAEEMLYDYNDRFSANDDSSKLMEISQKAGEKPVTVAPDLFSLIQTAKKVSLDSDRAFNLTIGPVIKLWKIGFEDAQVPSDEAVQEKLKLTDPEKVTLDPENLTVYLEEEGMEIDLGAIAKGFFADRLKAFFTQQGVKHGIIDLGGNVLIIGESPTREDGYWRIGLQHPKLPRGQAFAALKIKDQSVVTSGIYERALVKGEKVYHHIFDSRTGYPKENDIASVSIVSDLSIDGEIWTTILFVLDAKLAVYNIEQTEGIEGVVVTKEGQVLISSGLKNQLSMNQ